MNGERGTEKLLKNVGHFMSARASVNGCVMANRAGQWQIGMLGLKGTCNGNVEVGG